MTNRNEQLAREIEALTGPDREHDERAALMLGHIGYGTKTYPKHPHPVRVWRKHDGCPVGGVPCLTASLDAVVAEAARIGAQIEIRVIPDDCGEAGVRIKGRLCAHRGQSTNAARALLAALLRAVGEGE